MNVKRKIELLSLAAILTSAGFAQAAAPSWERPRTTRRALQPPRAERMFTLFNDGKICFAEFLYEKGSGPEREEQEPADACWFFCDDRPLDFHTARNIQPPDGVPVHGLEWTSNGVTTALSACCDWSRRPTCHGRFSVANGGTAAFRAEYSVRLRHGSEWALLGGMGKYGSYGPCFYIEYASHPESWRGILNDWTLDGTVAHSAAGAAMTFSKLPDGAGWNKTLGILTFPVALAPGERMTFDFTLGFGASVPCAYEATVSATTARWHEQLAKIGRLPKTVADDPEKVRLVKNLVVQILQCFAWPKGRDYIVPRQGGQHRGVWPWDNMEALAALEELGGFDDYVRDAIGFYFDVAGEPGALYDEENRGRIGPFTLDWDQNTANVLGILGRYAVRTNDRATWERRRARALEGFRWHMRTLVKPGTPGLHAGLRPPGRASDYLSPGQSVAFTDAESIRSLIWYVRAAEKFEDPAREEIRRDFDAYVAAFKRALEPYRRQARETGFFGLPRGFDNLKDRGATNNSYSCVAWIGLELGFLTADEIESLWKAWIAHGRTSKQGLAYLWRKSDSHQWYTTTKDSLWHHVLLKTGHRERAEKIFAADLRYAMTAEYYVGERYRDNKPWYLPWSPNVSGSGRIIQMLLEEAGMDLMR